MKVRLRVILPTLYLIIAGYLNGACFLHVGHWSGCKYAYYSMMPAVYLVPESFSFGIFLAFALGLAQYILLGYLFDKLLGSKYG